MNYTLTYKNILQWKRYQKDIMIDQQEDIDTC